MNESLEKITNNIPWTFKWAPKEFSDLILPEITKIKLENIIKSSTLEHSIFIGKSGCGKSATANLLARKLIPKEHARNIFLHLNASDERGLEMINDLIIPFCSKKYDNFPYKLIILDEASSITKKAQNIISNIMENNKKVKFILIVNSLDKISDSIQSRCSIMYFPAISQENIIIKLNQIAKKEKLQVDKKALKVISDLTQRDLRQSINFLEAIGGLSLKQKISDTDIYTYFDEPNQTMVENLLEYVIKKDLKNTIEKVDLFVKKGFSPNDILLSILNYIIYTCNKTFEEEKKIIIYQIVSKYYIRVNQGTETYWQIYGCLVDLCEKI